MQDARDDHAIVDPRLTRLPCGKFGLSAFPASSDGQNKLFPHDDRLQRLNQGSRRRGMPRRFALATRTTCAFRRRPRSRGRTYSGADLGQRRERMGLISLALGIVAEAAG
jgi:hypothetical protein